MARKKARKKKGKKEKVSRKKEVKKSKAALVLGLIAALILLINSLYVFSSKEQLIEKLNISLNVVDKNAAVMLPKFLNFIASAWLVLSVLMFIFIYLIEQKKIKWYGLLVLGLLSLISLRLGSAILAIVASVLYKNENRKR